MKIIIVISCLGLLVGCALLPSADNADAVALVGLLTNDDITWDGNIFGLHPTLKGSTAKRLLGLGRQASPSLRKALSDPTRFVAAHVLLTHIEKKEYQVSAYHWNNLEVDLHADGTTDLHPEQIEKIKAMWKEEPSGS